MSWDDPSGKRLRGWLEVGDRTVYGKRNFAIVPIGFCCPGTRDSGGDYPPCKGCGPLWHTVVLDALQRLELTLLVGSHAQACYLGKGYHKTVRSWRDNGPNILPTPHLSWWTTGWQKKKPWFNDKILRELRRRVEALVT